MSHIHICTVQRAQVRAELQRIQCFSSDLPGVQSLRQAVEVWNDFPLEIHILQPCTVHEQLDFGRALSVGKGQVKPR